MSVLEERDSLAARTSPGSLSFVVSGDKRSFREAMERLGLLAAERL